MPITHGSGEQELRLAIVTNIPAPYRVPVYNRLHREPGIALRAFYAARTEPDRDWDLPAIEYDHCFVPGTIYRRAGRFIHYNPGVWSALRDFDPDVVLTTGYNPTHLLAWLYALYMRRAHVVMTDGTDIAEQHLSWAHRAVRRIVFGATRSFVVASEGGRRLLRSYGVAASRIHVSPLCANAAVSWQPQPGTGRDIDLLFSGRLVPVKNAHFALRVAQGVSRQLGRRLTLAVLGSGPEEPALRAEARSMSAEVDVRFAGHVSQSAVPQWFLRSRVFLFPTLWDPWGVVANEACLAGMPVLISPHAGAAGELIRDRLNGRVLPLDEAAWVLAAAELLGEAALHARMAAAAREIVSLYDLEHAAAGIADAARQAAGTVARVTTVARTPRQ